MEKNLIPYGVQNFADVRRRGLYYVDKTAYIRELEVRSDKLFLVRPRRGRPSISSICTIRASSRSRRKRWRNWELGMRNWE